MRSLICWEDCKRDVDEMHAACEPGIGGLGVLQGEHLLHSLCPWNSICQRLSGLIQGEPKLLKQFVPKSQTLSSPALPVCSSDLRKLTFPWLRSSRRAKWLICWHARQHPSSYIQTAVVCSFEATKKQSLTGIPNTFWRDRDGPIDQRLPIVKRENRQAAPGVPLACANSTDEAQMVAARAPAQAGYLQNSICSTTQPSPVLSTSFPTLQTLSPALSSSLIATSAIS